MWLKSVSNFLFKGRNRKIDSVWFEKGSVVSKETNVGKYVFIGKNTVIGKNCAVIGSYVSIARECIVGPADHPTERLSTSAVFYSSKWGVVQKDHRHAVNSARPKVIIGHDVWIGARSIILPGVEIGNGAVIAAGAVVSRNVAPYSIVGGVPAKLIRYRFSDDVVDRLQKIQWWDLPVERVAMAYWNHSDIKDVLSELESIKCAKKC